MTDKTDALLTERGSTHGDFSVNADLSQRLKRILRESPGWTNLHPVHREALDVIALKVSRILSGKPYEPDHWADIAGYARLAERAAAPFDLGKAGQPAGLAEQIRQGASAMLRQPSNPAACYNCGGELIPRTSRTDDGMWCKRCGWKQ
jgi:hypothetical protein